MERGRNHGHKDGEGKSRVKSKQGVGNESELTTLELDFEKECLESKMFCKVEGRVSQVSLARWRVACGPCGSAADGRHAPRHYWFRRRLGQNFIAQYARELLELIHAPLAAPYIRPVLCNLHSEL